MSQSICPECKTPIPQSSVAGLCPDCLLKRGLERPMTGGSAFAVTTPQGGRQLPLNPESVAKHFPHLEILSVLGQGGMGTVFMARQTKLDRLVAVKIIRPETADDPAFAERFMREARTLARLSHPSVVGVHDFGEIQVDGKTPSGDGGKLFYFVMEYIDGANLRQLMQSGQLSLDLTLSIIPQVCDALQYAHDEGVVHRDIKPENIMLDQRGRVKIADFGLAKLADRTGDDWTLTGTHQVMGTPRYMAPEQMAGSRDVDHRADIYSLAVVFYEMLTGTIPVGHFAPPSQKSRGDVRLDEVILKAMASEPDLRFQSARELRSRVEHISATPNQKVSGESLAGSREHGFSTIIDRELVGAWRLVVGDSGKPTEKRTAVPIALLLLMSLAGCLAVLFPWFAVQTPLVSGDVTQSMSVDMGPNLVSPGYEVHGREIRVGILGASLFLITAIMWILVPERFRHTGWTLGSSLLLSLYALIACGLSRVEVEHAIPASKPQRQVENAAAFDHPGGTRLGPAILCVVQASQELAPESPAENQTQMSIPVTGVVPKAAYYVTLGCGIVLSIVSAAGLRKSVFGDTSSAEEGVRGDSVAISKEELASGIFPDICMISGQPTTNRILRTLEYQPRWAEAASLGGYTLGGIPGVMIHMMTSHEIPISCPVSVTYRNHWNRRAVFASIAWMIPILLGALSGLCGYLPFADMGGQRYAQDGYLAMIAGLFLGLICYLVPLIWMSWHIIKFDYLSDGRISLKRVSPAFASEVRRRQASKAV